MTEGQTARNERRKLLATWLNNASLAVIGAGLLSPLVAIFYGLGPTVEDDGTRLAGYALFTGIGFVLRIAASLTLKGMEE